MSRKVSCLFNIIEQNELIEKLKKHGFEDLIDAFLLNENRCFTKKGRTNKSGACRVMNCKPKQLEDMLEACKKILEKDIEL